MRRSRCVSKSLLLADHYPRHSSVYFASASRASSQYGGGLLCRWSRAAARSGAFFSVYFGVRDVMQARVEIFSARDICVTMVRQDGSSTERAFTDAGQIEFWIDSERAALDRR